MWNKVNVGYNAEEETANFGTRACVVNDVAVYETNTLAAILAGDQNPTCPPVVQAQFVAQVGLCVAIDSTLTVFSKDCSAVECVITCPSHIEVYTVSPCGSFVVIGLCGQVKCFHIPSKGTEVFSRTVHCKSGISSFISLHCSTENDQSSIFAVLKNGQVFRSTQFCFPKLEENLSLKNTSTDEDLMICDLKFTEILCLEEMQHQVQAELSLTEKESIFLVSAKNMCMVHFGNLEKDGSPLIDGLRIVKVGGVINDRVLFALCDDGSILQICLHKMTPYYRWTEFSVKDFVVLEGNGPNECNLLALIDTSQDGHQNIAFISWPDFNVKYRLPVAEPSFLIPQKGSEEILFLEGFGNGNIDTIRIKAIIESQPDLRLERILRRCKFEEAEKFARAFSLDLEIVYKAHVQKLSQDLGPWGLTLDQKKIFTKILELIEKIKDNCFVADICISMIPPDFAMLHTMLMYGMERFSKLSDKSGADLSKLLAQVSTIARRLDTCMLIHGSATTVQHWIEFPKHDLIMSCHNHIKRGEIKESVLIWSRHLSDMKPIITIESAKLLLCSIPKATKMPELMLLLHHFIPSTLAFFPNILTDVVRWTTQRARDLEILDGKSWPNSGLVLAKGVLRLVHTPPMEKSVLLQSQRVALRNENLSHQSPLNYLLQLIDTLDNINTLKEKYGVNIQYDQFVQEDHAGFVAVLLERLPLEKISLFMVEFYHRLMLERKLDSDTEILHFIQDIVMNCEDWWFWDEAPWEARVSALIPHINDIEIKLDAIFHVLKSAPVPWTATVTHLADQGVRLPHCKANDVRDECNNVPKRLIMKKYGLLIDKKQEIKLVRLILKKNLKNMLDDIKEVAKCAKGNMADIYLIVIINLIENGNETMVPEVLRSVSEECKAECMSRLIFHIHRLVSHYSLQKLPAYFNFMPMPENPKEKKFLCELKNIYHLKMEFNITTTIGQIFIPAVKQSILESFAHKIGQELASRNLAESMAVKKICRLANLLQITGEEGLIALASICVKQNLEMALAVSSKIEDLESKPSRVYNKVSVLIGLLTAYYKPTESSPVLIENFTNIISKMAKASLAYSTDCSLNNICKWASLLNISSSNAKSMLKIVYGDPAPTATTAVLTHSSIKHIISSYIKTCRLAEVPVHESISAVLINNPEFTIENREMMLIWQRLREEQQDLTCIRLVSEFCWSQKTANPLFQESITVETFLTQCVKDLLRKLFRLRNFDMELALSLLHFFGRDQAVEFLVAEAQSVGYNYQRLGAVSQLAITYNSINKIDKFTKSFRKHFISCKWAKKLNEFGLQYKDAFKDSETDHRQLILKLISLPSTTVPLLKEFCIDMCFDEQECLMMYLEYLLLNWEPDIDVTVDPSTGGKVIVVKNSENELLQKCRAILHQLGTKSKKSEQGLSWNDSIQSELCAFWTKVNYYYYEVYFVLADLCQKVLAHLAAGKKVGGYETMLGFLQNYTRISSPSETEQEQWFQLFPNTNSLPPISNFRLPFSPFFLKEPPWGIIKPELSLKTYKIWFDIIPSLGLDRDMLCTLTIQRLSSDQLGGGSRDKSSWRLQACNNSVLQEIRECVMHIGNQEMASAALYYVVNHMPAGADQMAAAQLCYLQAEMWIQHDTSEKARLGFAKVKKKYLTVCTSHILHSSGLGKPEYLQLVLHPQELICALYDDPSILLRKTGTLSHCPDINRVVLEIGHLQGVNVLGIQQELLSEWLYPPDSPPLDMSCDDITQNIAAIHNPITLTDNHSIIRACYVLESMEMETAAKYLVSYSGIREEDSRPTAVRLRALQCLCTIASPDVIVKTTGTTLDNLKASMQNLMFISELEKLGLVWSTTGFEMCDKEDVVRILLTKASPHAVQLAAAMGCIYKLTNTQYWDQILHLMTSYCMVEELTIVLPELTYMCHLLNNSTFISAWNCALIIPLQKAEYPLSEDNSYRVQRSLEMLYCCPVPRQVDLTAMLGHCQRLRSEDLAARLQPFLSLSQSTLQMTDTKQSPVLTSAQSEQPLLSNGLNPCFPLTCSTQQPASIKQERI